MAGVPERQDAAPNCIATSFGCCSDRSRQAVAATHPCLHAAECRQALARPLLIQ